jgi:hypothetical protein
MNRASPLIVSADAAQQTGEWSGPYPIRDRYLVGAVRNGSSVALENAETHHVITIRVFTYESQ